RAPSRCRSPRITRSSRRGLTGSPTAHSSAASRKTCSGAPSGASRRGSG
ncbi:MAG: hypothetical protein AVDCRST_MAG83-1840, partial [uncultured Arthrobacter sp.]